MVSRGTSSLFFFNGLIVPPFHTAISQIPNCYTDRQNPLKYSPHKGCTESETTEYESKGQSSRPQTRRRVARSCARVASALRSATSLRATMPQACDRRRRTDGELPSKENGRRTLIIKGTDLKCDEAENQRTLRRGAVAFCSVSISWM